MSVTDKTYCGKSACATDNDSRSEKGASSQLEQGYMVRIHSKAVQNRYDELSDYDNKKLGFNCPPSPYESKPGIRLSEENE